MEKHSRNLIFWTKTVVFISFSLITKLSSAQSTGSNEVTLLDGDTVYTNAEVLPEFPGGENAMFSFLAKNIRYPAREKNNKIIGTTYLTFVIAKTGEIKNIQVVRGIQNGEGLDNEAMRVIRLMPNWKPAKHNGNPVHMVFTLPVRFMLR